MCGSISTSDDDGPHGRTVPTTVSKPVPVLPTGIYGPLVCHTKPGTAVD